MGPQTEKALWPNCVCVRWTTAARDVVERRQRRPESPSLKVMRSKRLATQQCLLQYKNSSNMFTLEWTHPAIQACLFHTTMVNGHGIKLVRPLSTVDNTRDYAITSLTVLWTVQETDQNVFKSVPSVNSVGAAIVMYLVTGWSWNHKFNKYYASAARICCATLISRLNTRQHTLVVDFDENSLGNMQNMSRWVDF